MTGSSPVLADVYRLQDDEKVVRAVLHFGSLVAMAAILDVERVQMVALGRREFRVLCRPASVRSCQFKRCSLSQPVCADFFEDAGSLRGGIGGAGDLAADDQVVGAVADGFGGRGDALLIALGRTPAERTPGVTRILRPAR